MKAEHAAASETLDGQIRRKYVLSHLQQTTMTIVEVAAELGFDPDTVQYSSTDGRGIFTAIVLDG